MANTKLSRLALGASLFALIVIALGAYTRLIDAGLGCPDWPGCYGQLSVPVSPAAQQMAQELFPAARIVTHKAWAEMIHRYFVAGLSVLITLVAGFIFGSVNYRKRSNVILAIALLTLLTYQILLGQLTVTLKLLPLIVTLHLIGGFLILSVLWLIYLNNRVRRFGSIKTPVSRKTINYLLPMAAIGVGIVVFQISLGAWTSTNYASLSCPNFPFCFDGEYFELHLKEAFALLSPIGINYEGGVLSENIRQTIQMIHRVGALVVTVYLLFFVFIAVAKLKRVLELMASIFLVLGLLCIQLCLGIANIIFKLPLITALSHTVFAALLLLSLLTLTYKLSAYREPKS